MYDQFKREIKMKLEDRHDHSEIHLDAEVKSVFDQYYLANLSGPPPFMCMESEDFITNERIIC